MAGIWRHSDVDQMTFQDLCEANELLDVRQENTRRAREAAERG